MKSPLPKKKMIEFNTAILEVLNGKKVTRKEWKNKKTYVFMLDRVVCLHKDNGDYSWVLSDLDIEARDWIIV